MCFSLAREGNLSIGTQMMRSRDKPTLELKIEARKHNVSALVRALSAVHPARREVKKRRHSRRKSKRARAMEVSPARTQTACQSMSVEQEKGKQK